MARSRSIMSLRAHFTNPLSGNEKSGLVPSRHRIGALQYRFKVTMRLTTLQDPPPRCVVCRIFLVEKVGMGILTLGNGPRISALFVFQNIVICEVVRISPE